MLEALTKFICFIIMYGTGYFVVKKITSKEVERYKEANLYILLLAVVSIFLHKVQFTTIYTITVFLLNTIVYKKIFKITLSQSIVATSLFMIILTIPDMVVNTIFRLFWTQSQIRTDFFISISANILIAIMIVFLLEIKWLYKLINRFFTNFSSRKLLTDLIFLVLLVVGMVNLLYKYATVPELNSNYMTNIVIIVIFTVITIMFIQSKNEYKALSDEYDVLFSYVQNFEEWIEKEQLNRHEYKNQLAVLRTITKEKKVQNKIDEILEDNINLEGEVVSKLKDLPKGGLKGLMYYKAAIAQKQKIKLVVDVSLKSRTYLKKLTESQIKELCKLIGIYFDNAIEAAMETKEKYVLLEIYELSDKVNIVISNTFKMSVNFDKRNEKGVTTKGLGHGNGLYFASNIVSKNKWLESKQEVIDNYYVQTLSIEKLD